MKKILFITGIFFFLFFAHSVQAQLVSLNSSAYETNTFYSNETVYLKSSSNISTGATSIDIYIVNDINSWSNGTSLLGISYAKTTNTTNSSGYLEFTKIWSPTLTVGKFDIVADVNVDGMYNSTADYVDSLTSTGLEVLPEPVPLLTLALGPKNPSSHNWNYGNDSYNTMLQMKVTAGLVENVKISSIYLAAGGAGDDKNDIHVVYLVSDENNNAAYDTSDNLLSFGQYIRDNGILNLNLNDYTLTTNKTAYMIVVYTMTTSASNGKTYNFQIAGVSGSGTQTGRQAKIEGLPVTSATKTIVGGTTTTTTTSSTTASLTTTTTPTTTTTSGTTTTTTAPPPQINPMWIIVAIVALIVPVAAFILIFSKPSPRPESEFRVVKKLIFTILVFLLLISLATAENITNQTTTTTTIAKPPIVSTLKGIYNFLMSFNPILLLILGLILIVAAKAAKIVGIILIIVALIHLFVLLFG